jgi:cell division protein FtsI (penicillin-binding protein 3)
MRKSAKRVAFARVVFVVAFVGLGARAAHLSVFDQRGAVRGDAQSLRTLTLPPERGHIVDRNGAEFALSVEAPSVYAARAQIADIDATARQLATIFRIDARGLAERLRRSKGFHFVARWVSDKQADRVRALKLAGVGIVHEPRRAYPHGRLASRVVGFANIDGTGVRGIEQQEDAWLRGTTRRIPAERDGSGRLMLVREGESLGTAGGDVALTLDAALQANAERVLAEAVDALGARGGVIISMDPYTGEIYSLAESPSFDPNRFRSTDYSSTRSSAFLDTVEPGSALKPFLIAAALETGAITTDQIIDCGDGMFRIPGKTIRDARAYGELTATGILRVSSNIGAVKVATELGRSAHYEMLRRFGFGDSTHSQFPDESAGVLRPWRSWKPVDHATIAFGQGVSVTPIQLAAATAVLANGGEWVRPRLVAARRVARGAWQSTGPDVARRVLSRETAANVMAMLETVVGPDGTGSRAALPGVRVAGKTGTAQKFDTKNGRYSNDHFRAWFIGIVPADAPRLVVVVGIDEPRRPRHTGSGAAAPLFARVAAHQLAHFGIHVKEIPPAPQTHTVKREAAPANETPKKPAKSVAAARKEPVRVAHVSAPPPLPLPTVVNLNGRIIVPDFRGLTVAQVMEITAAHDLGVTIFGNGRAVQQAPLPGSIVSHDEEGIRVVFETDAAHDSMAASDTGGQG